MNCAHAMKRSIWKQQHTSSATPAHKQNHKLPMPDNEIIALYNGVPHRQKQRKYIGVLADLNGCHRADITAILHEHGVEPPVTRRTRYDWSGAFKLHRVGACDKEIAEHMGCPVTYVAKWRKRNRLGKNPDRELLSEEC